MINVGGIKVSPLELEEKIREAYPSIDVCVLGIPDPAGVYGEIPVVAYTGAARALTLAQMCSDLEQRVERAKLPHAVVRVSAIPKTENGKPLRHELRTLVLAAGRME
jgi:long-chain acyl-CoA synthetase